LEAPFQDELVSSGGFNLADGTRHFNLIYARPISQWRTVAGNQLLKGEETCWFNQHV
jgi:hypothetical protein